MLQTIRDGLVGWVAWVIVLIIGVPFAILGVTDFGSSAGALAVAEVDGEVVEQSDYRQRFQVRRRNMQQQLGPNYRPDRFDPVIQQQVLDTLIEESLLQKLSEDNNLQVGDEELSAALRSDPGFYKDGKFDFDTYRLKIGQMGFVPADYEELLRSDRKLSTVPRLIRASSFITELEATRFQRLINQKRVVDYILVNRDHFKEDIQVTDADARAYYESHKADFIRPEQVKLEYVRLSASQLVSGIDVTDEAVRKYYETNMDRYVVDEQRKASHILLDLQEGKRLEDEPEVLARLAEIQEKLKAGERFEDLAKKYSQDPGSAPAGGDLGQVLRGVMVPPFEEALFALTSVGQVSDPVRSSFGVHLIRLDGVTPRKAKSFEEVKEQIKANYASEQSVNTFFNLSERMAELSYENPDTLQPVVNTLNIPLQTTDWISRKNSNATGITGNKDIIAAAFSERLKGSGINSEPIEVGVNDAVVIRVADVRPQVQLEFEAAKEKIIAATKLQKESDRLSRYTAALADRVRSGKSVEAVAAEEKLSPVLNLELDREGKDVKAGLARNIFKMPTSGDSASKVQVVDLGSNEQAVIALKEIVQAESSDKYSQLATGLRRRIAAADADNYLAEIRERAEIVIFKENLE